MENSYSFVLKYDGEALKDHTIDIDDLAPALMAVSDAIREANRIANDDDAVVSVKVRATQEGSIEVVIAAIQTCFDSTTTLLSGRNATAIANLLTYLGFVGVGASSIIALIKKLKGKQPKSVTEKDDEIELDTEDETIIIKKIEWEIYESVIVRKSIYAILKPLEKEGVETVEFVDDKVISNKINKDEVSYYIPPEPIEKMLADNPPRQTYVRIVHLWFKDGHKWKFTEGDGGEWSAEIKDQKFIEKLLKGEVSIHSNDLFKVNVKQTQYRSGDGIKSDYEILEVLEHQRGYKQMPLL